MLHDSKFWSLVAGLLFYVIKYFVPDFPLDEATALKLLLAVLALFGVVVPGARAVGWIK